MYKIVFLSLTVFTILIGGSKTFAQILTTDFNAPVAVTTGKYPIATAIGDIDGDGKPDLVVANEGALTISVFQNIATAGSLLTTASFGPGVSLGAASFKGPETLLLKDMDGDGKLDAVVSNSNGNTISIFRNTSVSGTVSFATKVDFTVGNYTHGIALGDLDGDGKTDIAVCNYDAGTVSMLKNASVSGTLTFGTAVDFRPGGNPSSVGIADMDGDGKQDIIVVSNKPALVSIYRNVSLSTSFVAASLASRIDYQAGSAPFALNIADFDGDGHPDLAVTEVDLGNMVSVYRNTSTSGTISMTAKQDFATGNQPFSLTVADVDGDSKPDLVVGNWYNTGFISILKNSSISGSINFLAKVDLPAGTNPESVAVGDLNADGFKDIVCANSFDGTLSVFQYNPSTAPSPIQPVSTASVSIGSFVSTDLLDNEWKQDIPPNYFLAADSAGIINGNKKGGVGAGRFAYFSTVGSRLPLTGVNGSLTFSARGTGTIEVQLLATNNYTIQARQTFTLTSATTYQNFTWSIPNIYPQIELMVAVVFNGYNASSQATAQFQKNFCLNLRQCGLVGSFTRFRADSTSLIGNSEKNWYGWSDSYNLPKKKYLQHSAYARMRFTTSATQMVIEYVRDFYDKRVVNLFALTQTQNASDFDSGGNVISGTNAVNIYTRITGGQIYTISGMTTTTPTCVWYNNGKPMGAPQQLTNIGTVQAPVYSITAPVNATNLGLVVQRSGSGSNDSYLVYSNCMIQQGSVGTVTQYDGTIPSAFTPFGGYVPSHISGPAVFINGVLYKYYAVEGTDIAKIVQFVTDTLPAGSKTIDVMMPGQGTYLPASPFVRRAGNYLRAVYFPGSGTTVAPASTIITGSICYIHDSILSGYNISSDAQNNVWMMKTKRDPNYGFAGDIFSEGYSGRILYTDINTPALTSSFAAKLASFGVDKFWFQVGVNDYGFLTPLPAFYSQYKSLVEQLKLLRPNAKVYIQCTGPEIFEGPNGETTADDGLTTTGPSANDYRDVQRLLATTHSYCEYENFEGLFPATMDNTADGIHPTDVANISYANGIKYNSTLLGNTPATYTLAFYRSTSRNLIISVPGIYTITANGGKAPYTFTLLSGTLQAGLTFNADGSVTGTPTASGTVTLSVKVTDANSSTLTQSFTVTVNPVPSIVVARIHILDAVVNTYYSQVIKGYLGYGNYTMSVIAGALPAGMTLNPSTGLFSGIPTTLGTYNFTIKAIDHWGFNGSTAYTFHVVSSAPAALTDHFYPTAVVSGTTLIVTGHLHDIYDTQLYTYIYAYVTQGGTEYGVAGSLVNVNPYTINGQSVVFPGINTANGAVTSIRLNNGAVSPSALDGVNITYDANTVITP